MSAGIFFLIMLRNFVENELKKKYMYSLAATLLEDSKRIPKDNYFRVLKSIKEEDIKVVIVGQDPYPGFVVEFNKLRYYYNGRAFSTDTLKTPYSLKVLHKLFINTSKKEKVKDLSIENSLRSLERQGVLLINTLWSTREGRPLSHNYKEWIIFTRRLIRYLSSSHVGKKNKVFILFGSFASHLDNYINKENNLVLKEKHPASARYKNNTVDITNSDVLLKANIYLRSKRIEEIVWTGTKEGL